MTYHPHLPVRTSSFWHVFCPVSTSSPLPLSPTVPEAGLISNLLTYSIWQDMPRIPFVWVSCGKRCPYHTSPSSLLPHDRLTRQSWTNLNDFLRNAQRDWLVEYSDVEPTLGSYKLYVESECAPLHVSLLLLYSSDNPSEPLFPTAALKETLCIMAISIIYQSLNTYKSASLFGLFAPLWPCWLLQWHQWNLWLILLVQRDHSGRTWRWFHGAQGDIV